jgi:type 1 glutamine amidotransferase
MFGSCRGLLFVFLLGACSNSNHAGTPPPPFDAEGDGTSGAGGTGSFLPVGAVGGSGGSGLDQPSAIPLQPSGSGGTGGGASSSTGGQGGTAAGPIPDMPRPRVLSNVLVFTRTTGFRHDSISAGVTAIRNLGGANAFAVEQTEDPTKFSDQGLIPYQVVIFLSTTMDVLAADQQAAFERFIQAGGGWVGIHAAADTEYDWPWYGGLLGANAWFRGHPAIQTAELIVEEAGHPSTAHLPARFNMQDEWYSFRANPRPQVTVLLRLNEGTYQLESFAMGEDHPIAWYHEYAGGRAWYTGLGHRQELYADPAFLNHVLGGIRWAAGVAE